MYFLTLKRIRKNDLGVSKGYFDVHQTFQIRIWEDGVGNTYQLGCGVIRSVCNTSVSESCDLMRGTASKSLVACQINLVQGKSTASVEFYFVLVDEATRCYNKL